MRVSDTTQEISCWRHATIRAAKVEVLGLLRLGQVLEEIGLLIVHLFHPLVIVREEVLHVVTLLGRAVSQCQRSERRHVLPHLSRGGQFQIVEKESRAGGASAGVVVEAAAGQREADLRMHWAGSPVREQMLRGRQTHDDASSFE
eukprot:scaffold3867_cov150-Ochromonas_danica.AAC.4